MGETDAVKRVKHPNTIHTINQDLSRLGVKAGDILLVHSSLSSLGWVAGGPVAVIEALMGVLTQSGTLVMSTQSSDYSDPANWRNPPVPEAFAESLAKLISGFFRSVVLGVPSRAIRRGG